MKKKIKRDGAIGEGEGEREKKWREEEMDF